MSDSQRADEFMAENERLRRKLAACRKETADEVFKLASKVKKQGPWNIGGFIGEVQEEWEYLEWEYLENEKEARS